jgi:PhnB protein
LDITAHIVVPDADAASAWYARAFGAHEHGRIPLPSGKVITVEPHFGTSSVHVVSELPEAGILSPLSIGGTATVLQISTHDADALWQQALDAGAEISYPLADQFWGERRGQLIDPYGQRWNIAQHIHDVPTEELLAAAARSFGG